MAQKQQIFRNTGMSVAQAVVSGGILFVLYRYLLSTIGVEQIGIWSIVLAITAVLNLL